MLGAGGGWLNNAMIARTAHCDALSAQPRYTLVSTQQIILLHWGHFREIRARHTQVDLGLLVTLFEVPRHKMLCQLNIVVGQLLKSASCRWRVTTPT